MYRETTEDLNRKYHGTYVLYDGIISYISEFIMVDDVIMVEYVIRFVSSSGIETNKTINTEYDSKLLQEISIPSMFFNVRKPTSLFEIGYKYKKLSLRQNRRGLCSDVGKVTSVLGEIFQDHRQLQILTDNLWTYYPSWTFELVHSLVYPEYPTWSEIFDRINQERAIAISPDYLICLSNLSNTEYLLTSLYGFIGTVTPNKITIHHQIIAQELSDFIRRNNLPVTLHHA